MIKTKAIRRVQKSKEENIKDYYQTNPYMVKALNELFADMNVSTESKVIDPCEGKKVIKRGLKSYFKNVKGFDLFEGDSPVDFLETKERCDIIVMNPPYSNKYKFIDHALELADKVCCLLPLNISNYNMFFKEYENTETFQGKLQMSPKMFLNETTEFKAGGTSQYCWYIWDKNNKTKNSLTWYKDLREYLK